MAAFYITKASCLTASAVDKLLNSFTATGIPLKYILKHFPNVPSPRNSLLSLPVLSLAATSRFLDISLMPLRMFPAVVTDNNWEKRTTGVLNKEYYGSLRHAQQ